MDALLILAGLLLFLTALVWLVLRAFDTSLLWGWGSLIPPVTLLFVLGNWSKARTPVFLAGLAAGTVVVGLAQMAAKDPERVAEIFSLNWLQPEQPAGDLRIHLSGEFNGQRFAPQQAELIDGTLTLREGQDFYASRELIIRLPEQPTGAVSLDVLPQDLPPLPVIELSWLLPEQDLPEARRITHGYSLHLQLEPVAPNKLTGDFHLVLPARFKTSLRGRLELYTDRLRYREGKLDARHDSRETLSKVIEDYLQRRFRTSQVELAPLPPVGFSGNSLALNVAVRVQGQALQLPVQMEKNPERGWMVSDDRFPPLSAPLADKPPAAGEPSAVLAAQAAGARASDRRVQFSLERLLRQPDDYQNLMIRVRSERGSTAEGRFAGINPAGKLVIRQNLGAGEVSFNLRPDEVVRIELLEP
ncbi:MFS transporter [Pseudomonas sp. N040]|uniref:MFS transporter n=1 Tax=Pseudomonas sp. N040 TaxID=2785325 RepID=UPI0018A2B442|nr:MFS transporter [Pseudomonas sp. N040]MBF7730680.1 MFS transporter [Pseudomonas sp. N040]MBW7014323.1 MFS transporter [Pseudomonas sp. N040]